MPDLDDLIPTTEAARILGCTIWAVLRMVTAGRLTVAVKMPGPRGAHLYRRADVEALRDESEAAAS